MGTILFKIQLVIKNIHSGCLKLFITLNNDERLVLETDFQIGVFQRTAII